MIAEHQRFAAWLRARIQPTFDTSVFSAEAVADQVANWIRSLLGAAQLGEVLPTSPAT